MNNRHPWQGAIQKLLGQDFDHFRLPTYLNVDIFYPVSEKKESEKKNRNEESSLV